MEAQCYICGRQFEEKEIVQLACVPAEWDEGLTRQWLFACFKHEGVEGEADTEETENMHRLYMEHYDVPAFKVIADEPRLLIYMANMEDKENE